MPLLRTTSASSTVVYQSTIGLNCLVASTACANFAGTTRLVPLLSPADFAGIAIPPSTAFRPGTAAGVATPLIAVIGPSDNGWRAPFRRTQWDTPPSACPSLGTHRREEDRRHRLSRAILYRAATIGTVFL